jgi:ubiquitin-small subunit ribosomal protein S27Ae
MGEGKKPKSKSKHKVSQVWNKYKDKKARACPRCGPSVFLALHKNRCSCGKCGYSEMQKK